MMDPLHLPGNILSTLLESPLSLQSVSTNCGGVHREDSSENLSILDPCPRTSPSPSSVPSDLPSPTSTPCADPSSVIPKSVDSVPSNSPGLCFVPSGDPSRLIPVECPSSSSGCPSGDPKDVPTHKLEHPPNITTKDAVT